MSAFKKITSLSLLLLIVLINVSCGGGSSEGQDNSNINPDPVTSTPVTPPTNLVATPNAGANRSVNIGDTVQLDGSNSSDPESDALTYTWSIVSSPTDSLVTLDDSSSITPALVIDLPGSYLISLEVHDGFNLSVQDFIMITTLALQTISVDVPDSLNVGELNIITGDMAVEETLSTEAESEIILGSSKQTVLVTDAFDQVIFIGLANADNASNLVLNERSTAEALVALFPTISYTINANPDRENEIYNIINALPEVIALADTIKSRIDSGISSLLPMDDQLITALVSAIDAATGTVNSLLGPANRQTANRVEFVSTNTTKSGVNVTTTPKTLNNSGFDPLRVLEVTIENTYQRFITAGIYQNDSRIAPTNTVTMINPGGTGKLTVSPELFVDDKVEVQVFGPGLLANSFDPGWSDDRVYYATLRTVIKDIALPVISTILGAQKTDLRCSILPGADDLLIAVEYDAEVRNAVLAGDIMSVAITIVETYLDKLASGIVGNVVGCLGEGLGYKIVSEFSKGIFSQYLKIYRIASTSLDVGEVILDVANSHRNEWWVLRNYSAIPSITFDDMPVGSVAPIDITFHGDCQYPDPVENGVRSNQEWDFGDGIPVTLNDVSLSTEDRHYSKPGSHTVSLTCSDLDGASSTDSITFNIDQAQPVIEVSVPSLNLTLINNDTTPVDFGRYQTGGAGQDILFSILNTGTGDSQNSNHDLVISQLNILSSQQFVLKNTSLPINIPAGESRGFTLNYTPGIASISGDNGVVQIASNGLNSPFTFNVTGTATDLPVAKFILSQTSVNLGTPVFVDASSSTDLEDTIDQLQFRWNWTDSNFPVWGGIPFSSNRTANYTHTSPGTHTVWLQVMDSDGNISSISSKQIVVTPVPEIELRINGVVKPSGSTHDFGTMTVYGDAVSVQIEIASTGSGDLIVHSGGEVIPPGQSIFRSSSFAPYTVGQLTTTFSISSNDADESSYVIFMTANVIPPAPPVITVGSPQCYGNNGVTWYDYKIESTANGLLDYPSANGRRSVLWERGDNQYYDSNVVLCWQQSGGSNSQELIATDEFGQATSVTVNPPSCVIGVNYPFPGWSACADYY